MADIANFFNSIPGRAKKSGPTRREKEISNPEVDPQEENLFRSSLGLKFKCGVCGRRHKSSKASRLQSLKNCIRRLVKGRRGYYEHIRNVDWLPNEENPKRVRFEYCESSPLVGELPNNTIFRLTQPTLVEQYKEMAHRFDQVAVRRVTEEVSLQEILGAPNSKKYIEEKRDAFREAAPKRISQNREEEIRASKKLVAKLKKYESLKPEVWDLKEKERVSPYDLKWAGCIGLETIKTVTLNGKVLGAPELVRAFAPVEEIMNFFWCSHKNDEKDIVLYDIGLVKGFPAISWGFRVTRMARSMKHGRRGRRYRASSKSSKPRPNRVSHEMFFFSVWGSGTFINGGYNARYWAHNISMLARYGETLKKIVTNTESFRS